MNKIDHRLYTALVDVMLSVTDSKRSWISKHCSLYLYVYRLGG